MCQIPRSILRTLQDRVKNDKVISTNQQTPKIERVPLLVMANNSEIVQNKPKGGCSMRVGQIITKCNNQALKQGHCPEIFHVWSKIAHREDVNPQKWSNHATPS